MTTQEAVTILRCHNLWRKGARIPQATAGEISEAIDHVCDVLDAIRNAAKTYEYTDHCFIQISAADWQAWMEFDRNDWPNA